MEFTAYSVIVEKVTGNNLTLSPYTSPENPMKAIARRLAVIRAIGIPLNALGTLLSASCSRRPAKSTIASPKPREVENAYYAASPRL